MKLTRILLTLMFACCAVFTGAQEPTVVNSLETAQQAFEEANLAYTEENFQAALDRYRQIARAGYGTREVWGNAGNAAYRLGDVGNAVLYYNRALNVDPDYRQARENLESIQPVTNVVEDQGLGTAALRTFRFTPTWVFVVLTEVAFVWLLLSLFFLGRSAAGTDQRSLWFSRTVGGVLFFALSYAVLLAHGETRITAANAVVIQDKAITRQGPGEQFFQQLELPAGTLVTIRDDIKDGYVRFKLLDGRSGYIPVDAIERI